MPRNVVDDEGRVPDDLAVAGVFALIIGSGWWLLSLRGEAYEWGQYLLVGALTPLAVLLLGSLRGVVWPRRLLAGVGIAALVFYIVRAGRWVAVPLGVAQSLLIAALSRRRPRQTDVLLAVAAWSAATSIETSRTLATVVANHDFGWLLAPAVGLATVIGSMVLHGRSERGVAPRGRRALGACALALLALESFRADDLFHWASLYHWGVIIGPAEAVRQGGWLLWDVPAQYGFLSTLAIAGVPTASAWDAFFLLDAIACFVAAALIFGLLSERMHLAVALVVTLGAVLWLPGLHPSLPIMGGGVRVTPAAGPFRFVWCQVLLVLAASRPGRDWVLVVGSLVWLVGSLWSAESAVYCACTWLPAYVLQVWPRGSGARVRWLVLPPLLAVAAVLVVEAWYIVRLGHQPDWYAFVEVATNAGDERMALPIAPWQSVGVLVLGLWAVATVAVAGTRRARGLADLAPLVAAYGALWATSSYFVARSADVNVTNLVPMVCLVGAVVLRELRPGAGEGVRIALGAVLAAVLALVLATPQDWIPARGVAKRWALTVEDRRPVMKSEQLAFLHAADIRPGAPVIYYEMLGSPAWPPDAGPRVPDRLWLPVLPFGEFGFVSEPRRLLYLARYATRARASGWLIQNAAEPMTGQGWFFAALARTHRPGRQVDVGPWKATWYDYVER